MCACVCFILCQHVECGRACVFAIVSVSHAPRERHKTMINKYTRAVHESAVCSAGARYVTCEDHQKADDDGDDDDDDVH